MLKLFGLDPAKVQEEFEQLDAQRGDIERNYDVKLAQFRDVWAKWLLEYKKALSRQTQTNAQRRQRMNRVNPAFVLRNYLMQEAIEQAELEDDFTQVEKLLKCASEPFEEPSDKKMIQNPPTDAFDICVSCSS